GGLLLDQRGRAAHPILVRRGVVGDEANVAVFLAALSGLFAGGVGGEKTGYGLAAVQGRAGDGSGAAQSCEDQLTGFIGHNPLLGLACVFLSEPALSPPPEITQVQEKLLSPSAPLR